MHRDKKLTAARKILFITPELFCLYIQFDRHPEKILFGHTSVSGIRFFSGTASLAAF